MNDQTDWKVLQDCALLVHKQLQLEFAQEQGTVL